MSQHTPTPWKPAPSRTGGNGTRLVSDITDQHGKQIRVEICSFALEHNGKEHVTRLPSMANAYFVAEACNSHETLRRQRVDLIKALETIADGFPNGSAIGRFSLARNIARAALAKAQE